VKKWKGGEVERWRSGKVEKWRISETGCKDSPPGTGGVDSGSRSEPEDGVVE